MILRIYEHRCGVCGWDAMLDNTGLALEVAHVRLHAAGGTDTADNGLCVCTFHHNAFDRGALSLTDDRRILVFQHVRGSSGLDEWLLRNGGEPVRPRSRVRRHWSRPTSTGIGWRCSAIRQGIRS